MEQGYKRCYGCMNLVSEGQYCNCGFDINSYSMADYWQSPGYFFDERYELGRVIGEGGFGITYVGYDHRTNKKVAIKQLKQELGEQQRESILRLISLGKIESLVQVFDLTKVNDVWYIVMEYVEGINGVQYLSQLNTTLNSAQVVSLLMPIVHTVDILHQKGILHRDICTDNIMISYDLKVTLIDIDTVYIMSNDCAQDNRYNIKAGFTPIEQYQSNSIPGPWVDMYSMCATLYHFLTGRVPVPADNRMNGEALFTFEEMMIDVDARLANTIYTGLGLSAADRNISFDELSMIFQQIVNGDAVVSDFQANEPVDFDTKEPYVAEDVYKTFNGQDGTPDNVNIASVSPDLVMNTDESGKKKSKSKKKRVLIALISIFSLIIVLSGSIGVYIYLNKKADDKKEEKSEEDKAKEKSYEEALEMLESEDATEQLKAVAILKELGDYEDSFEKLYEMATKYANNGDYSNAVDIFEHLADSDYQDSAENLFKIADSYLAGKDFENAQEIYDYLKDAGKTSEDGITGEEAGKKCKFYSTYTGEYSNGKYEKAKENFESLGDYYCDEYSISAKEMVDKCREELAKEDVDSKDFDKYPEAEETLKEIEAYDSLAKMASYYVEAKKYSDAMEIYKYLDENTSNSYTNEIRNCEVGSKEEEKYKIYDKAASSSYDYSSDSMVSYVDAETVESALSQSYGEYRAEDGSIYNISVYELNGALYGIKNIQINSEENPYYVATLYNLGNTETEIKITFNEREELQKTDEYGYTYSTYVNTINVDGKLYYESSYFN